MEKMYYAFVLLCIGFIFVMLMLLCKLSLMPIAHTHDEKYDIV